MKLFLAAALFGSTFCDSFARGQVHSFEKVRLTDEFWAEGADFADFNQDGKMDVCCGPFWYQGPDFKQRHEFAPATASFKHKKDDGTEETIPGFEGARGVSNAYSECFLTYTYDFNGDGWPDIMVYGFPGKEAAWYENNKGKPGHWARHVVLNVLDNESPGLLDVTGDGKPEILCCSEGSLGYAQADWSHPERPWTFHAVSPNSPKDYHKFTHGIGCGDINGDGRIDVIEKEGWWEQPASLTNAVAWTKHPFHFAEAAAQMLVYDVNGDGLNDVITSLNAHGYGLAWYEQVLQNGQRSFRQHLILNPDATTNGAGVAFSQPHSLALIDMDGDGLQDVVTGKRFWAHGKNGPDPDSNGAAVLYWFKLVRPGAGEPYFIPNLIDNDSGVGTEVRAGYVSNKQHPDVVVGNKKGLFVLKHRLNGE
jgi:hypothetical protein